MRDEDQIDTAPVIMTDKTTVVFESLELGPGEHGEIVLLPDKPLRFPTLFVADKDKRGLIIIEAIFHGQAAIARLGQCQADMYRFGRKLDVMVTRDEPIKIVVINNSQKVANIGASLVDTPEDSTYHLDRDDLKGKG